MKFKGIKRNVFSERWDESLPIGNGTIGGLVHGNPFNETIETSQEELFVPMPFNNDARPFRGAHLVPELRRLILEGKYMEASKFYEAGLGEDGYPVGGMIWTNPFEVATNIKIDVDGDKEVTDYSQKLDFRTGECEILAKRGRLSIKRRAFVSRTRNIMPIIMESENGEPFNVTVSFAENPDIHDMESVTDYVDGDYIISEATHSEQESGYVSAMKVISNGTKESDGKCFRIMNATRLLLIYGIAPWKNRMKAKRVTLVHEIWNTPADYDELLREHEIIHRELFERVNVTFSDSEREYTNEELRELNSDDRVAPELFERMVDFGRYLEIASFGKLPPNLQGVWNGSANPPWSSDYTLDENIQMMMWQVLAGSLPEFARTYFDWLESFTDDFKKNAQAYYGCRGVFSAPRVSSDGYHRHFGHPWPMFFWTAGAGWLSQVYEDYYEYTGDTNTLLRGVKYWKEVVLFYEDFLVEDEAGKFMFIPSYSPENTPLGNDSPVSINATMDVAIAKEVYKNLINACELLDIEEENLPKWKAEYEKFPAYAVNEDGALKEWIPESMKDDYHHRHSSHLYVVFPGHEALEDGNEELLGWCHKAAELRLMDGVDAISGWGLAHLANISARLKDSDLWYMALNRLIQKFTLDNFFTGHNEHSLFQMDANLGITAAVFEMFAYSDMEKLELFPVITDKFDYVKVEGLRAKGSVRIKELKRDKDMFYAELDNQGRKMIRIVCPEGFSFENGDTEYELEPGESKTLKGILRK